MIEAEKLSRHEWNREIKHQWNWNFLFICQKKKERNLKLSFDENASKNNSSRRIFKSKLYSNDNISSSEKSMEQKSICFETLWNTQNNVRSRKTFTLQRNLLVPLKIWEKSVAFDAGKLLFLSEKWGWWWQKAFKSFGK